MQGLTLSTKPSALSTKPSALSTKPLTCILSKPGSRLCGPLAGETWHMSIIQRVILAAGCNIRKCKILEVDPYGIIRLEDSAGVKFDTCTKGTMLAFDGRVNPWFRVLSEGKYYNREIKMFTSTPADNPVTNGANWYHVMVFKEPIGLMQR